MAWPLLAALPVMGLAGGAMSLAGGVAALGGGLISGVGSAVGGIAKGLGSAVGAGGGRGGTGTNVIAAGGNQYGTMGLGGDGATNELMSLPSAGAMGGEVTSAEALASPQSGQSKMMAIFINMQRSLKAIENSMRKLVGMQRAELKGDRLAAEAQEAAVGLGAGETDDGDGGEQGEDKGGGLGGILKSLGGAVKSGWGRTPGILKALGLGALLFWMSRNRDKIAKAMVPFLQWIKDTSTWLIETPWETTTLMTEKGEMGIKDTLKQKAYDLLNSMFKPLGVQYNQGDGTLDLIQGSWLDMIIFWTGPTNIFKTIKALWEGKNPDTGEYFIPVWMRPPSEWEWYNKWKESKEKAGFDEDEPFYNIWSLWNGKNPVTGESFLPEWMNTPINEMSWYKDTAEFVSKVVADPKASIKALWEGKNPVTGESFLPEWMTTPFDKLPWFESFDSFMKNEVRDFMEGMLKWIWDPSIPSFFGVDFSKFKFELPSWREIFGLDDVPRIAGSGNIEEAAAVSSVDAVPGDIFSDEDKAEILRMENAIRANMAELAAYTDDRGRPIKGHTYESLKKFEDNIRGFREDLVDMYGDDGYTLPKYMQVQLPSEVFQSIEDRKLYGQSRLVAKQNEIVQLSSNRQPGFDRGGNVLIQNKGGDKTEVINQYHNAKLQAEADEWTQKALMSYQTRFSGLGRGLIGF